MKTEKRIVTEWYNKDAGQFYTVNTSLVKETTKYQEIELVESDEYGKVLLLDGFTQVVIKNEYEYHEPMVHFALLAHPSCKKVLIIGGGDGGILREVYKHKSVESVDFVELDEDVVTFSRKYLPEINAGSFDDKRTNLIFTDGRKFIENSSEKYDVIIMDMTDPFGPSALLYTAEFFTLVKKAFRNDDGIFVMHSESPVARPLAFGSIHQTLAHVFPIVRPVYNFVQMYGTLWSFAISSVKTDIKNIPNDKISSAFTGDLSNLKLLTPEIYYGMQYQYPYITELLKKSYKIIHDDDCVFPDIFMQTEF